MVQGAAGAVGSAASITSAGAAGRGGTEDVVAAASVGADLPRARPATRRRLSRGGLCPNPDGTFSDGCGTTYAKYEAQGQAQGAPMGSAEMER